MNIYVVEFMSTHCPTTPLYQTGYRGPYFFASREVVCNSKKDFSTNTKYKWFLTWSLKMFVQSNRLRLFVTLGTSVSR